MGMSTVADSMELDLEFDITGIKSLRAEAFWLELEYLFDHFQDSEEDNGTIELPYIICQGNSGRNYANDIISTKLISHLVNERYRDIHVIRISRNGIYHSLPEILFHSLSVGTTFANAEEIKAAFQYNRKKTEEVHRFFSIFDNEMFLTKVALFQRTLQWPNGDQRFIKQLVSKLLMLEHPNSHRQSMLLLSTLSKHADLKADYSAIGHLLSNLLEKKIIIRPVKHKFAEIPYSTLGEGTLGVNIGLTGDCYAEVDDLLVEIWLEEEQDLSTKTMQERTYVLQIMELFKIASSTIQIQYRVKDKQSGIVLGDNSYLGLNTLVCK